MHIAESNEARVEKLHPDRFTDMSGTITAIVGFVLGESWIEPDRNLLNLLVAAELSDDERAEFERLYLERVDDWQPVLSGPMPVTARLTRPDFGAPGVPA